MYADQGADTEKQYYVTDPHGNVVQLTDESGKVTKTYEYDSFGNEVNPDKKDDNPFRYCGEYYDKETEEIYLRARYYEPAVGRFLTRDTYTGEEDEPLSLHLYTYCENDGVNAVDPSGHKKRAVILVGSDYSSTDNCFKSNASTWKNEHKGYKTKTYQCWEFDSIDLLWKEIRDDNEKKKKKADVLVIMAHSSHDAITLCSNYKRPSYPSNLINAYSDFDSVKKLLKRNGKIYIHGCNAGGMAGYKNVMLKEKNNKYTGEMVYSKSIAQIIANKTKRTTFAYINYTTQRYNGGFRQVPIDENGESLRTFKYINQKGKVKKRKGKIKKGFTKFIPQNDNSIPIC